MGIEALVARQDSLFSSPQQTGESTTHPKITILHEHREKKGFNPSIPLASVLHNEYVRQREVEIKEGRYFPGELLPVRLDQPLLRQFLINQRRKNIRHEVKNTNGEMVKEGTPIDWYNPTQPFYDEGDRIMAVRFEARDSELSFVGFIKEDPQNGEYSFDLTRPIIDMAQDPSVTLDDKDNPVLGVVKIHADEDGKITSFNTIQFRGPNVRNLKNFQTIPGKDNRPVQLPDRVRASYRPQGEIGGPGKLAFRDYSTWEEYKNDVNSQPLTEADFLITNFHPKNHGGPNCPLQDGQVYGHIAEKEYDKKGKVIRLHYYAIWMLTDLQTGQILFQEDPETGGLKPLIKVVADRSDFDQVPEEIPDKDLENPQKTHDVVFTAGIEKLANGRVEVTMGISDTRAGRKEIRDPMQDVDLLNL